MFGDMFQSVFADVDQSKVNTEYLQHDALSDLLVYRAYDPKLDLYFNHNSMGFVIEVSPLIGSSEELGNLHSTLMASMPSGGALQIINWSSPNIDAKLAQWSRARTDGGEIVEKMAEKRAAFIRGKTLGVQHPVKAIPTNRRVFVVGWTEGSTGVAARSAICDFRNAVLTAFALPNQQRFPPEKLLSLLNEILDVGTPHLQAETEYTTELPIASQIRASSLEVRQDHLVSQGDKDVSIISGAVRKFPHEWTDGYGHLLLGEPNKISDRPHGPVLVTLSAVSKPAQKAAGELATNRAKLEQSEKSGFSKFVADFGGKRDEIARLAEEVDAGERIFETMYTVTCFVEGGKEQARQAITEMGKIYRRVGFNLNPERYLQLPIFIGSLPFGMTSEHMNTFKKVQRMRILKGKAVAGLAPVHGEWSGNSNGDGLLLLGRQGQTFCWNNFISNGNYNTAIVGKSGAGKSVLMQEIVTSVYANGGRVLVIDDGYSFKNSCDILGGAHIAFDGSTTLRLNPFSMLQADRMDTAEYSAEALELITRVVSSMASLGVQREGRVSGVEEQYITDAIKDVWDDKGADGEITDVYRRLLDKSEKEERLIDVCSRLKAFTRDGIYGPYFEGRSNVSIDNAFTVVELSDVKNQPSLEEVILQIIMFLGTELMYKTERNVPVVILMDEAWDMLKGEGTAAFIEGVVRRARKYTGALITGTQSIDDYYSNPASEVCLANSDWLIVMAQKDEVIDRMASQQKMSIDPGIAPVLKSITSVPGQFSELAIRGDSGWAFGRLVLDPFSLAVFSSKGDTVEHLRRRRESGMSVTDAIEDMIKKGVVS